jgi:hypothetical protein
MPCSILVYSMVLSFSKRLAVSTMSSVSIQPILRAMAEVSWLNRSRIGACFSASRVSIISSKDGFVNAGRLGGFLSASSSLRFSAILSLMACVFSQNALANLLCLMGNMTRNVPNKAILAAGKLARSTYGVGSVYPCVGARLCRASRVAAGPARLSMLLVVVASSCSLLLCDFVAVGCIAMGWCIGILAGVINCWGALTSRRCPVG